MGWEARTAVAALARRSLPALFLSLCLVLLWQVLRGPVSAPAYETPRHVIDNLVSSVRIGHSNTEAGYSYSYRNNRYNMTEQKVVFFKQGLQFYTHRAFRDDRGAFNIVRIFGIEKRNLISGNFTCLWLDNDDVTREVPGRKYLIDTSWPEWSEYFAFNIDCGLPRGAIPRTINLVSGVHDIDFAMLVEDTVMTNPRKDLAVCVKPITGKMDVAKLVEWIEIQILVGVDNFILYNSDLTGPARFVLEHYAGRGIVTIISFPFLSSVLRKVEPPQLSPESRYAVYQELYLVAYHDCLYRFRGSYKFLEFIDLDEVILPSGNPAESLPAAINRVMKLQPTAASFVFLTAWHFEESRKTDLDVPDYLYMARHPVANKPVDKQAKSVVVTDRTVTVNFHEILETTGKDFINQVVPWQGFAYLHHFRGKCKEVYPEQRCLELMGNTRMDPVVTRLTDRLKERVHDVLDHLQLTRHSLD